MRASAIAGKFVRKIALQTMVRDRNYGLAISPDCVHMVVSHSNNTLSVCSLPGGEHIRTFGSKGVGKCQFSGLTKSCFSVAGNILVAEKHNKRVQEVTVTGGHVRFIGVGVINDAICGISANAELIVVGKYNCTSNNRIMMFDTVTGAVVRAFGAYGGTAGCLMMNCNDIRFTPDSRHIIVAEGGCDIGRLSVFTLTGEFVRCIGEGELSDVCDMEFADNGDAIVCDSNCNRICVYSVNDSELLRQWGGEGDADGQFEIPTALAMCGSQLYVLDEYTDRVQVFE